TISSETPAIRPGVRVVPCACAPGMRIRVVDRTIDVWRVIPTGSPHTAAVRDHPAHISCSVCGDHLIRIVGIFLNSYISDVVCRRTGWNSVDFVRNGGGYDKWPVRTLG